MVKNLILILINVLALVVAIGGVSYSLTHWGSLPDQIPVHFNGSGQVDSWGPKGTPSVWIIVAVTVFIIFVLKQGLIAHLSRTYQGARKELCQTLQWMLALLNLEILILLSYLQFKTVQVAMDHSQSLPQWLLPVFLVSLFGTVAPVLIKAIKIKAQLDNGAAQ